jgi:hypothetical protein
LRLRQKIVTCNGCRAPGRECQRCSWRFASTSSIAKNFQRCLLSQSSHPSNSPNVSSYPHASSACRLRRSCSWNLSTPAPRCKQRDATVRLSSSGVHRCGGTKKVRAMAGSQLTLSPWPRCHLHTQFPSLLQQFNSLRLHFPSSLNFHLHGHEQMHRISYTKPRLLV